MILTGETEVLGDTPVSVTSFPTNLAWTDLGLNSGLHAEPFFVL